MNASHMSTVFAAWPSREDHGYAAAVKIALLLATGVSCHYSLTPPHIAAPTTVVAKKTLFERGVQWVTFCSKVCIAFFGHKATHAHLTRQTMVWMMALTDALATFVAWNELPFNRTGHPLLRISPAMVFGAVAVIFANLLRQRCFKELGRLFTFEISIQTDHTLITTGPYAVVRHPSYLGIYLTLLGSTLVGLAPGAWLRHYLFRTALFGSYRLLPDFGQVVVAILVVFWLVKTCFVFKCTHRRLGIEDSALQKVFGREWEAYARRVRWSVLPGIY